MIFSETRVAGAFVLESERHVDSRGFFTRLWCTDELAEHGLTNTLEQCSLSFNQHAGTLRGMHLQRAPHEEAKLVRCTAGAIFDVAVDLREDSPTYLGWHGVTLEPERGNGFFIPEGCAHGFLTLAASTEVVYFISQRYTPEASTGFRWDDPAFAIDWPAAPSVMSERDRWWPDYGLESRSIRSV